ncbi:hypothetical protein [Bradyrhizobium liaoningense]|uniref:hypothetical protein n=1 Tax=Bradyrhizobium liaoningense TaxID=43992 RepID=UPI001BA8C271|nr:hypothetical protein [Bradyrhizobium liaoningense]MBR0713965.1 hypothetical protein [Bradyrhizobium liaoningense]
MARNIGNRLTKLEQRRKGTDRLTRVAQDSRPDIITKSLQAESWQGRARSQSYTRYALGAMQEVGPDYTRISIETAQRVGAQLKSGLETAGISAEFRLQGSVPLNVHIRGVSDVDLLTLDLGLLTYSTMGALSMRGGYYSSVPTPKTSIGELFKLRVEAEKILKNRYPAATVDTSGGKAISVSGGSLARPVDVVPSHWHDGHEYQLSQQEHDRAVTILNKKVPETIDNLPFLHIKRVGERCDSVFGGLRKAIRLCKNVKADAIEEGTAINFPSFDIAATMYHADQDALKVGSFYELRILGEVQRFLDVLFHNETYAKTLRVPDGSRIIFDTQEKYEGMKRLSVEIDDLMKEVAKEQVPFLHIPIGQELTKSRDAIWSVQVPS